MQLQAGMSRVQLEIEGRRFHSLLLLASELREAVSECVRDSEFHRLRPQFTRNTFITSSPRWLITFTAILPEAGFSKGREVSLCNVSHASSLISAFSVVFSRSEEHTSELQSLR